MFRLLSNKRLTSNFFLYSTVISPKNTTLIIKDWRGTNIIMQQNIAENFSQSGLHYNSHGVGSFLRGETFLEALGSPRLL